MKVTKQSATLGGIMIAFACIVFQLGFWALLLEPIQNAFVSKNLANGTHDKPSAIIFGAFAAVIGFLFGAFTNIGNELTKAKAFGIEYPDLHFHDIFVKRSFWLWSLAWTVAYMIVVLFWWRGQI
jgi:hypothetical protein